MPNRYIRASAIESDSVNALSWRSEVFYRRLLNRVDDFGRYTANPSLVRAACFPLQIQKVKETDVVGMMNDCEEVGLIFRYLDSSGKPLLVMNKWEQGRAKNSDYEAPPQALCERMKTYVYINKRMHPTPTPTPTPTLGSAAGAAPAADSEWLAGLTKNPAYDGLNIGAEYGKMQAWCGANRKQPSRRRFVNWLNRAEKPMARQITIGPSSKPVEGPPNWRETLALARPGNTYEGAWNTLPPSLQDEIRNYNHP